MTHGRISADRTKRLHSGLYFAVVEQEEVWAFSSDCTQVLNGRVAWAYYNPQYTLRPAALNGHTCMRRTVA
jgi:hypothetical protein